MRYELVHPRYNLFRCETLRIQLQSYQKGRVSSEIGEMESHVFCSLDVHTQGCHDTSPSWLIIRKEVQPFRSLWSKLGENLQHFIVNLRDGIRHRFGCAGDAIYSMEGSVAATESSQLRISVAQLVIDFQESKEEKRW